MQFELSAGATVTQVEGMFACAVKLTRERWTNLSLQMRQNIYTKGAPIVQIKATTADGLALVGTITISKYSDSLTELVCDLKEDVPKGQVSKYRSKDYPSQAKLEEDVWWTLAGHR